MRHVRFRLAACALASVACTDGVRVGQETAAAVKGARGTMGRTVPAAVTDVRYAKTFRFSIENGFRVIDLKASIITWGGPAEGPQQQARIVLVPSGETLPALTGTFENATIVRTPVGRIATNFAPFEAMTRALGIADRLVAVGGAKSYDDSVRARALRGDIAQINYGWDTPPNLDVLAAARPDVFIMSMGDLSHAAHMKRVAQLGIPVVPVFLDGEADYMGRMEYIRVVGLLAGRELQADAFVDTVAQNVNRLISAAAAQPQRPVISAWFAGGDRWMATIRNSDAKLLRDANGRNLLEQPDDAKQDAFQRIGTETMLERGREAECWIARDTHSAPFTVTSVLQQFRAYRDGCMFASDGVSKPAADAWDFYETAVIRPDIVLGDIVRMLHPALRSEPFQYIRPDTRVAR